MNTYILPIADVSSDPCAWVETTKARSLNEAKDKFMEKAVRDWDIDVPGDWQDFKEILRESQIVVGTIADIEEL